MTGQCSECERKKLAPERDSTNGENASEAPIVHEVLRSPIPNIQPKLKIGQPNDKYEQEADRIADQIIRMPAFSMQRQITPEDEEEELIQRKVTFSPTPLNSGLSSTEAPPVVHNVLHSPGQPLDPETRTFMESRFRHDFSRVKIHADGQAAESAQAVNARAFTVGQNVVFDSGQYQPRSLQGQRLLAHELTHVIHQGQAWSIHPSNKQPRAQSIVSPVITPSVMPYPSAIQRAINTDCLRHLKETKFDSVCKPPGSPKRQGTEIHTELQERWQKKGKKTHYKEVPAPFGAKNPPISPAVAVLRKSLLGKIDLLKVTKRTPQTVEVQVAEIKPLNAEGVGGVFEAEYYATKIREAGPKCVSPETSEDKAFCKKIDAVGRTVEVTDPSGLSWSPGYFSMNLFGVPRRLIALSCYPGLTAYRCLEKDDKKKKKKDKGKKKDRKAPSKGKAKVPRKSSRLPRGGVGRVAGFAGKIFGVAGTVAQALEYYSQYQEIKAQVEEFKKAYEAQWAAYEAIRGSLRPPATTQDAPVVTAPTPAPVKPDEPKKTATDTKKPVQVYSISKGRLATKETRISEKELGVSYYALKFMSLTPVDKGIIYDILLSQFDCQEVLKRGRSLLGGIQKSYTFDGYVKRTDYEKLSTLLGTQVKMVRSLCGLSNLPKDPSNKDMPDGDRIEVILSWIEGSVSETISATCEGAGTKEIWNCSYEGNLSNLKRITDSTSEEPPEYELVVNLNRVAGGQTSNWTYSISVLDADDGLSDFPGTILSDVTTEGSMPEGICEENRYPGDSVLAYILLHYAAGCE